MSALPPLGYQKAEGVAKIILDSLKAQGRYAASEPNLFTLYFAAAKKHSNRQSGLFHSVEMERFELSSKRGINLLSTCLSSPSIVGCKQDRSHPLEPYPLKFHLEPETYSKLSPILLHHLIGTLRSHSIRVMSRPRNFCRD